MANFSFVDHIGDGVTTVFPFSFVGQGKGYIRDSDVYAYVDGSESLFVLSGENQVTFAAAPKIGSKIRIRRIMPKNEPFANFSRGNAFTQDLLNKSFLQTLYAYHEFLDGFLPEFPFKLKGSLDMSEGRIVGLLEPIENDEPVIKSQLLKLYQDLQEYSSEGLLAAALANGTANIAGVSSGDLARRYQTTVYATDYLPEGSVDIAIGIQNAINQTQLSGLRSVKVIVTPRKDALYWDWSQEVDISADSWIEVSGEGMIPVKATANLRSFAILGVNNKLNASSFHGFSCNAGSFSHQAALWVSASRALGIYDIETKADAGGSFQDAVMIDDRNNTSGEVGSALELNTVTNIYDSGDSSVTRSMVRFESDAVGVKVSGIRATRGNFSSIVSSRLGVALNGCKIEDLLATFPTERASKCDSLVDLQGSISGTKISGVRTLDGSGSPSTERLVRLSNPSGLPALNVIENINGKYSVKDIDVDSGFYLTQINGTYTNGGVPGENGITQSQPQLTPTGGLIVDTTNKSVWVESEGEFIPAFDRRTFILPDDFSVSVITGTNDPRAFGSLISISVEGGADYSGIVYWRTAFASEAVKYAGGGFLTARTGVLTGTTGNDGEVTISSDQATGRLYIENRSGAGRRLSLAFLS